MADLAIGFSKTVVEVLANKVKEAIKEEAEQWQIVERDLVFITGEFEMMQSFLNVADEERVKNYVVRTWVRQVRDLSYDVEDCIEFVIHLDNKRAWWLRLWNMVPSCNCRKGTPQRDIDRAVAEIKQLKARVEDVSHRNLRYSLISDSGSQPSTQHRSASHSPVSAATVDMFVEDRETARKHRGLVDLVNLISKKDVDLQVISVWGTGGDLGMTSMIKEAYEEQEICKNFTFRAWVKLVHPLNSQEFIRSLRAQFYANSGRGNVSPGDLGEEFVHQINTQRYLVVIEDLPSMAVWHAVRTYLADWKNGSRIVVSTHQVEIARLCTGRPYKVSELRKFSADHSVCIFYKINPEYPKGPQQTDNQVGAPSLEEEADNWLMNRLPVGRDLEADRLFKLITLRDSNEEKPYVVSVWGVAGVGKSTLVQTVYYRCVKEKKFDLYGRVDVSQQFNLLSFSRRMLLRMRPESPQAAEHIQECKKLIQKHRCLVVIDGLQSKEDWDLINDMLICGTSRGCIVVVTPEESVATHCAVTENSAVHVRGLDVDAAIVLFNKELKKNRTYVNSSTMREVKALFSSKCGGLPRVIFSLCSYLATRPKDKQEHDCRHLTASFMHELETNPEFCSLRGLLAWMHSYFHACSRSLKLCILYASIFPGNSVTRRRRLVRRWIAEGYSKGTDSNTMVDYAEGLFNKLAVQSMISRSTEERATVSGCQVNGFFREYIISRPMEEKILFPLEITVLEGNSFPTTERVGQHLAVDKSWERDKIVFDSLDFSRLRSLTVYGEWKPYFISHRMRVLRVLDLENTVNLTNEDLKEIGELLLRLKFLSLRGCKGISHLPDSLGDLRQLQTLDIRHTNVDTLPPSIMKLQRLQYIRAGTFKESSTRASSGLRSFFFRFIEPKTFGGTDGGVQVASGIGKMTALHTLGVINVCAVGWEDTMRELRKLTQLRKLGVSGVTKKNAKEFSTAISGHAHLESLSVWGQKLPGIMSLSNLKKLRLDMTELTQLDLGDLWNLKRLQTLRLRAKEVEKGKLQFFVKPIGISLEDPFSEIKFLEIVCLSRLEVEFSDNVMGKLELLNVDCSHAPSFQISGLEYPVSLKRVMLKGPNEDIRKKELQDAVRGQLDKNPKKPTLDPR